MLDAQAALQQGARGVEAQEYTQRTVLRLAEAAGANGGANAEPEDALSVVSITAWRTMNLGRSPSAMAGARRMSAVQTDRPCVYHCGARESPRACAVCSGRMRTPQHCAAESAQWLTEERLRSAETNWPALST